ncbi:unnamed protein product [Medioppia subpectinata]|uniref:UDP-glycosyltransferase n=1 Tax=Medioppia subpectinata TaxID=1979941 RepID=A0A7R9KNS4_9ACAR|nr:unnamed protein product [Medioppia subpectinata]CAG2105980.1 unnamed protein product [Medioppia subpectinata]
MVKKLTILLAPLEAVGSVNPCIGLAEVLLSRGHRIVFAVNQSFAGKLSPFGFIEEILNDETGKLPAENSAKSLLASGLLEDLTPEESMKMMCKTPIFADLIDKMRAIEPKLKAIIAKYNPDVYIISDFAASPTIIHSNKPWIRISASQPLSGIKDDRTPPGWSANVDLMKRLVSILSISQHKIIVSKGVLGDTYELADNMWGEKSVPQTKVLPLVDVVITHGGNNSVTETFSCGKPMIVMPLFGDQYDNAQRVMEKGFGIRLNPHTVSEQELLDSIEKLLNDKELKHKLSVASKRIQNSDSIQKAAEIIENLV